MADCAMMLVGLEGEAFIERGSVTAETDEGGGGVGSAAVDCRSKEVERLRDVIVGLGQLR